MGLILKQNVCPVVNLNRDLGRPKTAHHELIFVSLVVSFYEGVSPFSWYRFLGVKCLAL